VEEEDDRASAFCRERCKVCVRVLGGSTLLGGVAEEEHESGEAESDVSEVCEQGLELVCAGVGGDQRAARTRILA
jgi:hypothetical protein